MSEGKKEILLGDCLDIMPLIPDNSVDMICADIPFGVTYLLYLRITNSN